MKTLMRILAFACITACLCSCTPGQSQTGTTDSASDGGKYEEEPDNYEEIQNFSLTDPAHVKRLGRVYVEDGGLAFNSSASGAEIRFVGMSASITLHATGYAAANDRPYVYFLVDGARPQDSEPVAIKKEETIFSVENLSEGLHSLRLVRRSEGGMGETRIDSVSCDGVFVTPRKTSRKMLVFGDSITCGYGIMSESLAEKFSTETEDALLTFAGLTATAFDADAMFICKSGIALNKSVWGGEDNLPWLFERTDLVNSEPWDHTVFVPDVIVINIGANDNTYINSATNLIDMRARTREFIDVYTNFLIRLCELYPEAKIYCVTNMLGEGSAMLSNIDSAIAAAGVTNAVSLSLTAMNKEDGYGADNHPNYKTHASSAQLLIEKIEEVSGWKIKNQ